MKIVFLLQDTGAIFGAERATIELVAGLRSRGVDVTVLLISEERMATTLTLTLAFRKTKATVESVPVSGRFSKQLVAVIRERVVGATCLHSIGYKADIHGRVALRGSNIPQVGTVHGWLFRSDLKERLYAWINLAALRRMDAVVALSRHYAGYLREHGIRRVVRIPTGHAVGEPVTGAGEPFTFGLLGRLSSEKNPLMFVQAAAEVARSSPETRFLIGGSGPERPAVERAIIAAGMVEHIELTGYVPAADFLSNIDALVLCSDIENQPLVLMEAMARGLPVIATSVGGVPELVDEGSTGWLVPAGDAGRLSNAMRECLANPEAALAKGRAGREKLQREFPSDRWIDAHVAMYGALASSAADFQSLENAVKSTLMEP